MSIQIEFAHSPGWGDPQKTRINLVVKFAHLTEEIPFSADQDDAAQYGHELFARALAGEYGLIADYAVPAPTSAAKKSQILASLAALDAKSIRPLREGDAARISELDEQAAALRAELAAL